MMAIKGQPAAAAFLDEERRKKEREKEREKEKEKRKEKIEPLTVESLLNPIVKVFIYNTKICFCDLSSNLNECMYLI